MTSASCRWVWGTCSLFVRACMHGCVCQHRELVCVQCDRGPLGGAGCGAFWVWELCGLLLCHTNPSHTAHNCQNHPAAAVAAGPLLAGLSTGLQSTFSASAPPQHVCLCVCSSAGDAGAHRQRHHVCRPARTHHRGASEPLVWPCWRPSCCRHWHARGHPAGVELPQGGDP